MSIIQMSSTDDLVLIFATAANDDLASDICTELLMNNVVGLAHYWSGITNLEKWGLEVHSRDQVGMIFLTRATLAGRAVEQAKAMYSYDTPTIVVLDIKGGNAPFLQWIIGRTAHPE